MGLNIPDRNAGFAAAQAQVVGFGKETAIDSKIYGAPGSKIFYVDPNNAQAVNFGNTGEDKTVPLATIAAAVTLTRDHMGDTIVVASNDAWQYAPQTNRPIQVIESVVIPSTKGGIRIVGESTTPWGVAWSPAGAGETALTIHAIDVVVEGFAFYTSFANCDAILVEWDGVTTYGENATIRGNYFETSMDNAISLDFSWFGQIYGNYFDANTVAILNLSVGGDPDYDDPRQPVYGLY